MKEAAWLDDDIILYDGICALCSGWVRFVAARDRAGRFRFTPIQSPYGRALANAAGIDPDDPDTNALVLGDAILRQSDAALAVLAALPGWRAIRLLRLVPRGLRDAIYRIVARNRYRLFGRHAACDLGGTSLAARVLTDLPAATPQP